MESSRDMKLQSPVVLITGASQGIGRKVAQYFAHEGAWIAINYFVDHSGAKALLDTIRSEGGRALLAPGYVGDPEGAWHTVELVQQQWAQVDILIHTAGLLHTEEYICESTPLINEVHLRMQRRKWGRIVIFSPEDAQPHLLPSSSGIFTTEVRISYNTSYEGLDDALAQVALILSS